jgi:hypothetical protein
MMEAKLKGVIKFGETQIEQIEYLFLMYFYVWIADGFIHVRQRSESGRNTFLL